MLVTMKSILDHANKHNYAVMAINCINMEMVRGAIAAAEEEHSPIIIQMGIGQINNHAHMEDIAPIVQNIARRANVPVALNLDHGGKWEDEVRAMKLGYTNVMIDASALSYEENKSRTALVVTAAHAMGISVEAELGHVGQADAGDGRTDDMYTNVEQAVEFVQETGCDALAVAIGTAHGQYPEGYVPKLDFDRLAELKAALQMPLVLHGGSGAGEENLRRAVAGGINKVNVATDAFQVAKDAVLAKLEENPKANYMQMEMAAEAGVKAFVKDYIHVLGSNDRYTFEDKDTGSKE
ncbi:class II fructose-bisphosphate aldolase [Enorma phocaeensis]|uniref:class II fructose-bisphosphate aldolase n=1 Tax=Enorma phocaeensis TaxID=1871019 RepID=UPI000C8643DF|nr:class II fructose-bisphosphate aldolase [Enorma phocaeensis]